MRPLIDAVLATVQTALEPAAFVEAFAAEQQMTLTEAFATLGSLNQPEKQSLSPSGKGSMI